MSITFFHHRIIPPFLLFPVGHGRGSDLRWERLQHGVPRGEADARRQDLPDLRGNRADPAHHHLQGVARHRQTENGTVIHTSSLPVAGQMVVFIFTTFICCHCFIILYVFSANY
jgi:hypothetical protein